MAESETPKFDSLKSELDSDFELRRTWLQSVRTRAQQDVEKLFRELGNNEWTGPGREWRTEAMSMVGRALFASTKDEELDQVSAVREAMLEEMAEDCFGRVAKEWKKWGLAPDEESKQTYIQAFVSRFGLGNPPAEA